MISKIAGHNDFHKITKAKASKAFIEKTAQASKQVINIQNSTNVKNSFQQTPYDAFLAQQTLSEAKKALLFKKQ